MKIKLLCILFLTILLSACANPSEELSISTPETESSDSAVADEADATKNSSEIEPYILTFKANSITGDTYTSDIFTKSKLTMINVWATYCNPCLSEMPDLSEIVSSYDSANFQMLGIISDVTEESRDGISTANELIAKTGADNYPHLLLNDSLNNNLVGTISSVPTTFFVNQDSEVLGYVVGANSKETWEEIINELLAQME